MAARTGLFSVRGWCSEGAGCGGALGGPALAGGALGGPVPPVMGPMPMALSTLDTEAQAPPWYGEYTWFDTDDTDLGPCESTGVWAGVPGPGAGGGVAGCAAVQPDEGCGDSVGMVGSAGGTDAGCTELGLGSGDGAADCGDLSGSGVVWPAPAPTPAPAPQGTRLAGLAG